MTRSSSRRRLSQLLDTRVRQGREVGLSLPELLVTMALMTIVGALAITMVATMSQAFTKDRSTTDSTNIASVVMNELSRVIRAGTEIRVQNTAQSKPVFVTAAADEILMHAYIDTDSITPEPVQIRFWLNSNRELVESRYRAIGTAPYWNFQSSPYSTRVIGRTVAPPAGGDPAMFTYEDAAGHILVPQPSGFNTNQLRSIARVNIFLKIQADPTQRSQPVILRNTVGIPNLGITL